MPINPLEVPNFGNVQAYSGGADFTPLAKLGDIYAATQDRNRMLSTLGQLGQDPTQNAMLMIRSGNPDIAAQGLHLMQQITAQKDIEQRQAESVREFETRNKIAQAQEARAAEDARRASPEYRLGVAKANNLDMSDPEVQGYIQGGDYPGVKPNVGLGQLTWAKKTNPDTGEEEDVAYERDKRGNLIEAKPPPGTRLVPPTEVLEQKAELSKTRSDAVQKQEDAKLAAQRAINSANHMDELVKKSFHMGKWGSEHLADILQHAPEGTPGKEAASATLEMRNEALREMMTHVKESFGGRPSDREDQWMLEAQAAVGADLRTQQNIIKRGRDLAKENLFVAKKTAEDMRSGAYYKKGYVAPEIPTEVTPPAPAGTTPPPAATSPQDASLADIMREKARRLKAAK
jgi:hypothetical protein